MFNVFVLFEFLFLLFYGYFYLFHIILRKIFIHFTSFYYKILLKTLRQLTTEYSGQKSLSFFFSFANETNKSGFTASVVVRARLWSVGPRIGLFQRDTFLQYTV